MKEQLFPIVMIFILSLRKEGEIHFTLAIYKSIQNTCVSFLCGQLKKNGISSV